MSQFIIINDPKIAKIVAEWSKGIASAGIAFMTDFQVDNAPAFNAIIAVGENGCINVRGIIIKKGLFGTKIETASPVDNKDKIIGIQRKNIVSSSFDPQNSNIFIITHKVNNTVNTQKASFSVTAENKPAIDEMIKVLGLKE